ncbi:MAG: DnaJ domain-containing protein [Acidobacteriota bacterium]|nr:DnaJ domain-containing protein [Acidobacteriota bacterium]
MADGRSFYDVLGVMPDAADQQIRRRFKELARRIHPDRFQGDEKEQAELDFQSVTQAFNVLTDPNRRRDHDFELAQASSGRQEHDADRALKVYMQRGHKAFREKKWAEAAESFRRAAEERPDHGRAWFQLAAVCMRNPRWRSHAVDAVSRACDLEPMNVGYLALAGRIMVDAGFAAKAERFYTDALHWGGADAAIEQAVADLRRSR